MQTKLISWLKDAGLDEQRAKLYIANLTLGPSRASELARELGLSRTAIYDNLMHLESRGFISHSVEKKILVYEAVSPQELRRKFAGHLSQLEEILPDFIKLNLSMGKGPFIHVFRGAGCARHVFEDILEIEPKEYRYISNPLETYKTLTRKFFEGWVKRRVKKKIQAVALRTVRLDNPSDDIFSREDKYLRRIRYLPLDIKLKSAIYMYGKNIGIISSYREEKSIIIRSADIAATFEQIFELLWAVSN